jgi:hypothetical protein
MLPIPDDVLRDRAAHGGEIASIRNPLSTTMPLGIQATAPTLTTEGHGMSITSDVGGVGVVVLSGTKVRCGYTDQGRNHVSLQSKQHLASGDAQHRRLREIDLIHALDMAMIMVRGCIVVVVVEHERPTMRVSRRAFQSLWLLFSS